MMFVELYRQVRRLRTWIAFGALTALPAIAAIANRTRPGRHADLREQAIFAFTSASGLNHALTSLAFMSPFFLVIVVANFAGESVAGEASWGTLRALLTRPVGRARLLASKLVVAAVLAVAATLTIALAGLISGTLAFGWHPLQMPLTGPYGTASGLGRLALVTGYIALTTLSIVTFAFMLSTMTDHAGGAIAGGVGLAVVSQILDALASLKWLHPWLPTHYWDAWLEMFVPGGARRAMLRGVASALAYAAGFGSIAFWGFRRKDILS